MLTSKRGTGKEFKRMEGGVVTCLRDEVIANDIRM